MLALWEYFWDTDLATDITLSGPTSGYIDAASTNFTVGTNGSISGTLVVTISNAGGIGVLSQSVFSLSSGAASGTFTYTPSTLGAHIISETNNQSLTDAASLTYSSEAVPVVNTNLSNAGGGGYDRMPSDFWLVRDRYLRQLSSRSAPPPSMAISKPAPLPVTIKSPSTTATSPQNLPPTFDAAKLHRYALELEAAIKAAALTKTRVELAASAQRIKLLQTIVHEATRIRTSKRRTRNNRIKKLKLLAALLAKTLQ